jgi:3-oxoacyl-[acyl-carrier protein] reductase
MKKMIPLGKLGNPEDVADLALFLGSEGSKYITGEVIKVDGGMYV